MTTLRIEFGKLFYSDKYGFNFSIPNSKNKISLNYEAKVTPENPFQHVDIDLDELLGEMTKWEK